MVTEKVNCHPKDHHYLMVIEYFWFAKKKRECHMFLEKAHNEGFFLKTYDMPPFCVDQKVLVTIEKGDYKFLVPTTLVTKTF